MDDLRRKDADPFVRGRRAVIDHIGTPQQTHVGIPVAAVCDEKVHPVGHVLLGPTQHVVDPGCLPARLEEALSHVTPRESSDSSHEYPSRHRLNPSVWPRGYHRARRRLRKRS